MIPGNLVNPRGLMLVVVFGLGGLMVASAIPTPGDAFDLDVSAEVEWHSIREFWEIRDLQVETEDSRLFSWSAFKNNLAFFPTGSDAKTVVFTLTTESGDVVAKETQSTGKGSWQGTITTVGATLTKIPPGDYTLTAEIVDDARVLDATSMPVTLSGMGGGS